MPSMSLTSTGSTSTLASTGFQMADFSRIGFVWDVFKDKSLKVRGGTGVFTGRLPLVFFTNMPTNASMVQNSVTFKTQYDNGKVVV